MEDFGLGLIMEDIILKELPEEEYFEESQWPMIASDPEDQVEERNLVDGSAASKEDPSDEVEEENNNDEIVELLTEIRDSLKEGESNDERDMEFVQRNDSSDSISDSNVSDNSVESVVSVNSILNKPIEEYTVSESFLFFISISLFIGGIVILIKKGLPRWR